MVENSDKVDARSPKRSLGPAFMPNLSATLSLEMAPHDFDR